MLKINKNNILIYVSIPVFVLSMLNTSISYAIDKNYFAGNDIVFYDPTAQECSANSEVPTGNITDGKDNRAKLWNFFISTKFKALGDKPFNAIQAAGAIGNFYVESGWKPSAVEAGGRGPGYGLAQWSFERKTVLFNLASSMGKPWSSWEVQLKMIQNELDGSEGTNLMSKGFGSVSDPKTASYIFMKAYERAGVPNQANRDNAAIQAYKDLQGTAPDPSYDLSGGDSGGDSCTEGDGGSDNKQYNKGKATFVTKDGFPVYMQSDPRWSQKPYSSSRIGPSGCGPTTMTMVINALTNDSITPDVIAAEAAAGGMYIPGAGSSWEIAPFLAKKHGLKAKAVGSNAAAITAAVKAGGFAVMSGQGSIPFTRGGHYIGIRGVAPDGKWKVADPAHKEANDATYNPSSLLSMANSGSIYIISK